MIRRVAPSVLGFLLAGAPSLAHAHLVNTRLGDFYGGMLHPLTGFEYALPWLAVAILAAFQGPRNGRWLFLVFPLGLLLGAGLFMVAPGWSFAPFVNVVLIAGVGLLVALAAVLPFPAFIALAAVMAVAHGYDNAQAMAYDTDRVLFIGGITAIGYAFIAMATGFCVAFLAGSGGWRPVALRAGGSWIAAVGLMVLGFQLVRAGGAG